MAAKPKTPYQLHELPIQGGGAFPTAPLTEHVYDMSALHQWDGNLVAGYNDVSLMRQHAMFMRPDVIDTMQRWAEMHPTVDPRTWVPLAQAGIDPQSTDGMSISGADIYARVKDQSYGTMVGQPAAISPPVNPPLNSGSGGGGGAWGWLKHAAADVAKFPFEAVNAATNATGPVGQLAKDQIRFAETALAAPYQTVIGAIPRTVEGDQHYRDLVVDKYKLTPDMERTIFSSGHKGEVKSVPGVSFGRAGGPQAIPGHEQRELRSLDSYSPDEQKRMNDALAEYNTTGRRGAHQSFLAAVGTQSELGQMVLNPDSLMYTTDKDGKKIRETSWMPTKANQVRSEAEALKVSDIRSAAEIARGVAPTAWTLGRGIAHVWYSPDEQAFHTVSGLGDIAGSLFLDPVNLVPMGAAGHLVELGNVGARAAIRATGREIAPTLRQGLKTGGERAVVSVPTKQFQTAVRDEAGEIVRDANGKPVMGGAAGAALGAREGLTTDTLIADAVGSGSKRVAESGIRTSKTDRWNEELGAMSGPHGNYVLAQKAWQWMTSGRGARVIDYLAGETSAHKIWLASGKKMDYQVATDLAATRSAAEARAVLGTRMGYEIRDAGELGGIGKSGPALFRNRALYDSGGLFTARGRQAFGANYKTARAMTPEDAGLLRRGLGAADAAVTSASTYGIGFFRQGVSAKAIDAEDSQILATQLDAFMRGAHIPTDDYVTASGAKRIGAATAIDRVMAASAGGGKFHAIYEGEDSLLYGVVKKALEDQGVKEHHAKRLTTAFRGGLDEWERNYTNSDIPDGFGTAAGNQGMPVLENEQLSRNIVLPDFRTIRRATSGLQKVLNSHGGDLIENEARLSDWAQGMTSAWRYSVLVRPAYILRELGELAFSMGLGGYKGPITHPAAFIALVHQALLSKHLADIDTRMARLASGNPGLKATQWSAIKLTAGLARLHPKFNPVIARINGDPFYKEYNEVLDTNSTEPLSAMYRGLAGGNGNWQIDQQGGRAASKNATRLLRDTPEHQDGYIGALVDKVDRLHNDRDMRNIANPEMSQAEEMAAFEGGTHDIKQQMRPDLLDGSDKSKQAFMQGNRDLVNKITLGDTAMLEAVRSGKFEGRNIVVHAKNGRSYVDKGFKKHIEDMMADDAKRQQMPPVLHEFGSDYAKNRYGNRFVNGFFTATGEFSDLFARGPLIRQAYAKRVIELAPDMSSAARADAIKRLRDAGDTKLARQVQLATKSNREGPLGIDEVDTIASGFALKESERLFYDAHKRQNYALAMRVVSPFAQATFNTFRRWGEMSLRNPQMGYRSIKPVEALMDPGSAAIYGAMSQAIPGDDGFEALYSPHDPSLNADGFFATNSFGDRTFYYPAIGSLASLLPGVHGTPTIASATAESLNVAGSTAFPGSGPMLTLPMSLVLPNSIYRDDAVGDVMKTVNPFGLPSGSVLSKIITDLSPTWTRRLEANSDPEQAANGTIKAIPALFGTGDYGDGSNNNDQRRLINDAKTVSSTINIMTAIGVAFTPGSFTSQYLIAAKGDRTGDIRRLMLVDTLNQEYQKYTKALPGQDPLLAQEQGRARFVKDFGGTALLSVLPRTDVDGPQATNDIWHWRNQNPKAYALNSDVVGNFFAGGDIQNDFSQNLYRWQQSTGERHPKKPKDFMVDVNNAMGWLEWNPQQAAIDAMPTDQQPVARRRLRDQIERKYPGWTGESGDLGNFDTEMNKMRDALKVPAIRSLASAEYVDTWMNTRDEAVKFLQDKYGVTGLKTKAAVDSGVVQQLLDVARDLRQQDKSGGFTNAWSRLFKKDFDKDVLDG